MVSYINYIYIYSCIVCIYSFILIKTYPLNEYKYFKLSQNTNKYNII